MHSRKLSLIHLVILLCLSVFAFSTHGTASQKDGLLKVYFLDVGQGDSIFIETPTGSQVLVDGGPDNSVLQRLGEVMPFYDRSIDLVVLTHSDADHLTGLIEVLRRYDVDNILYSDIVRDSTRYQVWKEEVGRENANISDPVAGKIISLGNEVVLKVVHPQQSLIDESKKKVNNDSVVLMLEYGETEILLTGDIEAAAERKIILSRTDIDADILKIAHHGSKTSTIEEFLFEVSPEAAIIQVGAKNKYGHPTTEVMNRLEKFGVKYYRNDLEGTIKLESDGKNYLISSLKNYGKN